MSALVRPELLEIALGRANGAAFEEFSSRFFSALLGEQFVPLGGVKDGGADGFIETGLWEDTTRAETFLQASIEPRFEAKIESTFARLAEFNRTVKVLYYATSQKIKHIDQVEDGLFDSLKQRVKIRDLGFFVGHINDNDGTRNAYHTALSPLTEFLTDAGSSSWIAARPAIQNPSAYVFLRQEVDNRLGNVGLIQTITDSLIIWALKDTDPDKKKFLNLDEIKTRIVSTLPWAKHYLDAHFRTRLAVLVKKSGDLKRKVQYHPKEKAFCIPYETRQAISEENADDEILRLRAGGQVTSDLAELKIPARLHDVAVTATFRTLEVFFEREGLSFSHFLNGEKTEPLTATLVAECLADVLDELSVKPSDREVLASAVFEVTRRFFYASSTEQREFLLRLSKTYVLMFTLRGDPRVVEFFQGMVKKFRLFVGTDVLLLALTETFLKKEDQRARNLIRLAREVGCELYLSEPILDELFTHIRATDLEFVNHYAEQEPYFTREIISHCDRILIRTYFYGKFIGAIKLGWKGFINSFCDYEVVRSAAGRDQIRQYLVNQFNLQYVDRDALEKTVSSAKVDGLAKKLLDEGIKGREDLARNDALMVHGVYGFRSQHAETTTAGSEFGFLTWWLTHETRIQRQTVDVVIDHSGSRYIMQPAFLMNYFAMCPSKSDVLKSYREIFPTVIGLQMGHRLDPSVYKKVLELIEEWKGLEEGRRAAKMSSLSDRLKTDHFRVREFTLDSIIKDYQ